MEDSLNNKKFFKGKRFYLHMVRSNQNTVEKTVELIKLFGGQIEIFLDNEVKYILTDIPESEWPPHGRDMMLERAANTKNSRLISLQNLKWFCSKYVTSAAPSSDEDESYKPFIRIEDEKCHYRPLVKEFSQWPQITLSSNIQLGRSIFSDSASQPSTPNPSYQNTTQNQPQQQQQQQPRGVRRKHAVLCEICNQRVGNNETIDDHIKTDKHQKNTEDLEWREVRSVIDSLPSFETLNKRRLTNGQDESNGIPPQEFVCLHKIDSASQLFVNSNRNP